MTYENRKELLWVSVISTLILFWGSIPTWAGYQAETQDLRFRGAYFDSQDYAVHISMMEAGKHGETAYQFRFTTESHNPAYLRLFYIALGHVSRLFNMATDTIFQFARWLLGYFALYHLYKLIRRIFTELFWARTAFLLAATGSGLGWLQLTLNWINDPITPIDFWLIDSYVFFSLSLFPHFALVMACSCIVLNLWLTYLETPHWKNIVQIVVISILVQTVNPIALATVDAGLAGATFATWWKNRKIRRTDISALGVIAISQLPLLAYNFAVLNNDPVWSQFTAQNKTLSPPPNYYLWGLAPFLPFALIAVLDLVRSKSNTSAAALFWVVAGSMLAYAPLLIQRRFMQNITIPLAILATQGLIRLFATRPAKSPIVKRWQKSFVLVFVFSASLSSIQLSLGRTLFLQTHPADLYYPASVDTATSWLRENAQYNDFVLAAEKTSQVLAQDAGMRVYLGHEMETLNYMNKQKLVDSFFANNMDSLATTPVHWVIYGIYEKQINPYFQPAANLELVYSEQGLNIYEVK